MTKTKVLTGITPSGVPHIGNYAGAIRPAILASEDVSAESYFFLADYHGMIKNHDPDLLMESSRSVAATWLASGLDPSRVVFYRQSDIPEITELCWILTTITAKGLMNRAHAYKAAASENVESNETDADRGVEMGLFSYPILMTADILLFKGEKIPVGKDQLQHIEMARDIAQRFNYLYGETFVLPEAIVDETSMIVPGLDGRKMSKSYNNTIPLFDGEKKLKKIINKVKTNSLEPGEPKDPDDCSLFAIYSAFTGEAEQTALRKRYAEGISWGDTKKFLFEFLNEELKDKREEYNRLMESPAELDRILAEGAAKARVIATPFLAEIRRKVGLGPLG